MEREISEDAVQALRNLILMIASLTTCGFIELKPSNAAIGSPFNIPGFSIPQPQGKGLIFPQIISLLSFCNIDMSNNSYFNGFIANYSEILFLLKKNILTFKYFLYLLL